MHNEWAGVTEGLGRLVAELAASRLESYRSTPGDVLEHANIERNNATGGYGRRQIFELVQNGADAILDGGDTGGIEIRLTDEALYCANEGAPLDEDGLEALLASHRSPKRGVHIGRFGLGFKSVLEVSSTPYVLSRTGSIGFDIEMAADAISSATGRRFDRYPVLRVPHAIDPHGLAAGDRHLVELMSWATTVVKLPLDASRYEWLAQHLANFPQEFLLFSPHVEELRLRDLRLDRAFERTIRAREGEDGVIEIGEDGLMTPWRLFTREVFPSPEAREDAGEWADRESIPLSWAVPIDPDGGRGRFWAFFPTAVMTTLAGIINAPWKMNNDRRNILEGRFNEELIDSIAQLICDNLNTLSRPDDPCRHIDALPAARRDRRSGPLDERLATSVYDLLRNYRIVPDQSGALHHPADLELQPSDLPTDALDIWDASGEGPRNWVHRSVSASRLRHARLRELIDEADHVTWLEALASNRTPYASIAAIRAWKHVRSELKAWMIEDFDKADVVLATDGRAYPVRDPSLVIVSGSPSVPASDVIVDPEVARHAEAAEILRAHGVQVLAEEDEFRTTLRRVAAGEPIDWDPFWRLIRRETINDSLAELAASRVDPRAIFVKTVADTWRPATEVMLPGTIVDGMIDPSVCVDTLRHGSHERVLRWLGITDGPEPDVTRTDRWAPWERYLSEARAAYYLQDLASRPQEDFLQFRATPSFQGPLAVLAVMNDDSRARYTVALLKAGGDLNPWEMAHRTRREVYPVLEFEHPLVWTLRIWGRLPTRLGPMPLELCVHPALAPVSDYLPSAEIDTELANLIGLPPSPQDLSATHWRSAFSAACDGDNPASAGRLYAAAANFVARPERLLAITPAGPAPVGAGDVVVADVRLAHVLADRGRKVVPVENAGPTHPLVTEWDLTYEGLDARRRLRAEGGNEPQPLGEMFPAILASGVNALQVVTADRVLAEVDVAGSPSTEEVLIELEGDTLYIADATSDEEIAGFLFEALGMVVGVGELAATAPESVASLVREIADAPDDATRVVAAIGRDPILSTLPEPLTADVDIEDAQIGRLALAVWGVDVLRVFSHILDRKGMRPPTTWTGGTRARRFVTDLGFPAEYAGFANVSEPKLLIVEGPTTLPDLHDFQEQMRARLRSMLEGPPTRGVLSLPTGAGKTRIAVQSIVEHMAAVDSYRAIWIAQTRELCEQAVQTFTQAWRAIGPAADLAISRLWKGNDAVPVPGHHVVVAGIDKLNSILSKAGRYRWLAEPDLLVIDEAHRSITRSYSEVLRFLGYRVGPSGADPAPLIGLTATPFRGVNVEETRLLVSRYDGYRLDDELGVGDIYAHLRNIGVLASVDHEILEGSRITLTNAQLAYLERFRDLPADVEEKIGRDRTRTHRLVDRIRRLDPATPTLVFAASVEHSEVLAALLDLEGISARPISAQTRPAARHHYVEGFRNGDIRVLTNYNVLAEGFDAPRVGAVVVARPTFSPNRYQQIIGRGLRGPANGGNERCIIVNVNDNFERFGEKLAFTEFDRLWSR